MTDTKPEHTKRTKGRPIGERLHHDIAAAYAYVASVAHTADAPGIAWRGWALREAFLAGISYAKKEGINAMPDTCPKCGRPREADAARMALLACPSEDDPVCFVVAAAYQRGRRDGIDEGVWIAKEWVEVEELHGHEYVNFENVERKAEKAKERTR